ncbi:MAG: site-specific integrase [Gammaproteobacteria bacterium]|nr:MAG: site-specific integrase [Gammaproteobacteria bacterium]
MASIEARTNGIGKTSYRVKVRLKGRPPLTATFERKTDAKRWAQDTESRIREGRYFDTVEAKHHTVAAMIERYTKHVLPAKKSARDQARQLRWWEGEIGDYTLADVTPALIVECRDKLKSESNGRGSNRSESTVNRYLAAISHVFTIARKEWHWVKDNPLQNVSTLKEPRGRVRFLSDDERRRLLEASKAHSDQLYTIIVLALSTGARQGEILGLRWDNVDLARGLIVLEDTKNGERRGIPLKGHALDMVRNLGKVRRLDTDLLFPSRRHPTKPLSVQEIWKTAIKRAKIEDFRFHDLRHSAASYLAMNGASLAEIADVLGHKTLQMVKRYAHLSEQHTAGVVARMNERIFG